MGGGGVNIPQRNLTKELNTLYGKGWPLQYQNYTGFVGSEPLLSAAQPFALQNLADINQLIDPLKSLEGRLPAQFANYQSQLADIQGAVPGLQRQLAGDQTQLSQDLAQIPGMRRQLQGDIGQLSPLVRTQQGVYNELLPILRSQGALTPEQNRDVTQATRAAYAARGNVAGNQALGAELLNRDQYRQQRFANTLGQALGLSGSIQGLTGQEAGLTGQEAGLTQLAAGLTGEKAGITGQSAGLDQLLAALTGQRAGLTGAQAGLTEGLSQGQQGLQAGGLQQVLGTEQAQVGDYATLINPLLSYAQDVASSNQNAAAAQSIAGANKGSSLIGSGASIIGSIAAAY